VNAQCDEINDIVDKYDTKGMLIGEAPCTEDLIKVTDHDFNIVNSVSIVLVGLIIIFVFKSASLPILLVSVIEFAIFINMGIPHYTGAVLPFVASIVIGTIQLGSTVDYAILMTNKYKTARLEGMDRDGAITEALSGSINSIFVSALSFFAATFGVGVYSKIDMISSLCILMSRGAIISMFVVILLLPAVLKIFDKVIIHTTAGFRGIKGIKNTFKKRMA
jgi:predicted RND superfamily exporter protein